jgi:hypothetical protein
LIAEFAFCDLVDFDCTVCGIFLAYDSSAVRFFTKVIFFTFDEIEIATKVYFISMFFNCTKLDFDVGIGIKIEIPITFDNIDQKFRRESKLIISIWIPIEIPTKLISVETPYRR